MNKRVWFFVLLMFFSAERAFATLINCVEYPTAQFDHSTYKIVDFNYNQIFASLKAQDFVRCDPKSKIRYHTNFKVASGNTDLTGSSPYGINTSMISIIGSSANTETLNAAKTWLVSNFKISFNLKAGNNAVNPKFILTPDVTYNISPDTNNSEGLTIVYNTAGIPFATSYFQYEWAFGSFMGLTMNLTGTVKPTVAIINALNGATVRIHLGTFNYIYGPAEDLTTTNEVSGSTEVYEDLTLNFISPTCTMAHQAINLAPVSNGVLNSQQIANEYSFFIYIGCTSDMSNRVLLAKITDSYTPNNINNNGVLKNQPRLPNKSNVDVQLLDENSTPLVIGSQNIFTTIPAGSIGFSKMLKARYYLSEPKATGGYVKTQATVFLDYQ